MDNVYVLTDAEITKRVAEVLKEARLKQDITQQELAQKTELSIASIKRTEEGELKSFNTFIRLLRVLGKLDIINPLLEAEQMSPTEYYKFVNATKQNTRKRASKREQPKKKEDTEW